METYLQIYLSLTPENSTHENVRGEESLYSPLEVQRIFLKYKSNLTTCISFHLLPLDIRIKSKFLAWLRSLTSWIVTECWTFDSRHTSSLLVPRTHYLSLVLRLCIWHSIWLELSTLPSHPLLA